MNHEDRYFEVADRVIDFLNKYEKDALDMPVAEEVISVRRELVADLLRKEFASK